MPFHGLVSILGVSTMVKKFSKVSLFKGEGSMPLSLPLVLPSSYTFDFDAMELTQNKKESADDFKLIPEALDLLKEVTKPVAVVCISGPYRSGKSYFLSRILGDKEIFQLGHTMHACTRGIWMATTVLECEEFSLLLLDTEGINATDQSSSPDVTKLLVMTMLLCSMFVYNSTNVPRGRDMKRMRYIFRVSYGGGGGGGCREILPPDCPISSN